MGTHMILQAIKDTLPEDAWSLSVKLDVRIGMKVKARVSMKSWKVDVPVVPPAEPKA